MFSALKKAALALALCLALASPRPSLAQPQASGWNVQLAVSATTVTPITPPAGSPALVVRVVAYCYIPSSYSGSVYFGQANGPYVVSSSSGVLIPPGTWFPLLLGNAASTAFYATSSLTIYCYGA